MQKRRSAAGAQLSEGPAVKAKHKKAHRGGRPVVLETRAAKTNSAESPRGPASGSSRPPAKVGGPRSYGWKDRPNNCNLSFLVSLNRQRTGGQQWAPEGLWSGYSSVCPKGTICWAPVAVTQAGGGSSVPTPLCAKNQAKKNCEHQSDV